MRIEKRFEPRLAALAVGVFLVAFGCGVAEENAERPVAMFVASGGANVDLNIASWEVWNEGDDLRVVGRDAAFARRAEMLVSHDATQPDEVLQLAVRFPELGSARLRRDGTVEGASSAYLRRLAAAVSSDIGERGEPLALRGETPAAGINSESQAVLLGNSGDIAMPFSWWGYSTSVNVGDTCGIGQLTGAHSDFNAFSDGGASCWVIDWFDPAIPTDCRIRVHIGDHGWHSDTCHWTVHWNTFL